LTTRSSLTLAFIAAAVAFDILLVIYTGSSARFVEYPLPMEETHRFFDLGIVDANGDDMLDIYTTNHHFRQARLLSDGRGGYHDVLSKWGLDQSQDFPFQSQHSLLPCSTDPGCLSTGSGPRSYFVLMV
jgi:hypothetical protein